LQMEKDDKGSTLIRIGVSGESSFWYRPTRVVPDQRPLNGRSSCVSTGATFPVAPVESAPMVGGWFSGEKQSLQLALRSTARRA